MSWNHELPEMSKPRATALHRPAATGAATWALASYFETLLTDEESGGILGASLVTQPVGTATSLHVHSREAEAFYLLDGEMTYRAGDEEFEVRPGDLVWLPPGIPHAFRVTGRTPVRFLGLALPGGLFHLYDEAGRPTDQRRLPSPDEAPLAPDVERWLALAPSYGLRVVGPPLPAPQSMPSGERRPVAVEERKKS